MAVTSINEGTAGRFLTAAGRPPTGTLRRMSALPPARGGTVPVPAKFLPSASVRGTAAGLPGMVELPGTVELPGRGITVATMDDHRTGGDDRRRSLSGVR